MAFLIEILLPLESIDGRAGHPEFNKVMQELTRKFGGATAFTRSPADGRWKKGEKTVKDVVIVIEVVIDHVNRSWWRRYAKNLAQRFNQDQVLIRSTRVSRLDS